MLCLTREENETLIVEIGGERLEIKVLSTHKKFVKLGLSAPKSVTILRVSNDTALVT